MMRYSFSDFLNYQNELNNKYDQKVVDAMIDRILIGLKELVESHPTTHVYIAADYSIYNNKFKPCYADCSLIELKAVKEYFEKMGFAVEYLRCYSETPFNDSVNGIRGFALTW